MRRREHGRGSGALGELRRDDAGTTLIELLVGMLVMGVFMTIFTGAVVSMAKTTTKVEAVTTSASSVNNAFLTLDRTVRYASAVTTPGVGSDGNWYVELDNVVYSGDSAQSQCIQLRVDVITKSLQLRTWTPVTATTYSSPVAPPAWKPLAANITNGSAAAGSSDQPFTIPPALAPASSSFQRLSVTLVAGTSGPSSTSKTRVSVTFTALNSAASDDTNSTRCRQVGRS